MSRVTLRLCALALALLAAGIVADLGPLPSAEAMPVDYEDGGADQPAEMDPAAVQVLSRSQIPASAFTLEPGVAAASRMARTEGLNQDELINLGFESAAFPEAPWFLFDEKEGLSGAEGLNAWSRQTCQVDDVNGGSAAAWVAGGGVEGSALDCGVDIGSGTSTLLVNNEIDTSAHPFGFEVDFRLWLDLPVGSQAFNICAGDAELRNLTCQYIVIDARLRQESWLFLASPLYFKDVGGQAAASLVFWFNDEDGTGEYAGAFLDNVVVTGLATAPTPDPNEGPSPTPTEPATAEPTIAVNTPTPTKTNTPVGGGLEAYLPILMRAARSEDMPGSQKLVIEFGTAQDASGRAVNKAKKFQYGIMSLCAQVSWFGYEDGTEVSWQWFQKQGPRFIEIPGTLNDSTFVELEDYATRCIVAQDNGEDVPIYPNEYRVEASVNGERPPAAAEIAEVLDGVPPGATPLPPSPTPGPTVAPSPTGSTPPEGGCEPVLENGDFERGDAVGWSLITNVQPPNDTLARIIRRGADAGAAAAGGDWLALMGGGLNVREQMSSNYFDLPDPSQIISASLNYNFGYVTDETADGNSTDTFYAALVSQDNEGVRLAASEYSEEDTSLQPGGWYRFNNPLSVTELLTKRDGWDRARVMFESSQNDADGTFHLVDEVELIVCTRDGFQAADEGLDQRTHDGVRIVDSLDGAVGPAKWQRSGDIGADTETLR